MTAPELLPFLWHRFLHWLKLEPCIADAVWRGDKLIMQIKCTGCGQIVDEWPTGERSSRRVE